jgi:hypothetical protein
MALRLYNLEFDKLCVFADILAESHRSSETSRAVSLWIEQGIVGGQRRHKTQARRSITPPNDIGLDHAPWGQGHHDVRADGQLQALIET